MRLLFVCMVSTIVLVLTASAHADRFRSARPWADVHAPTIGTAQSIGEYRAGCIQGAQALPADGDGYVLLRPYRRRYFGHPALIRFIQDYARKLLHARLGMITVGDLGQARGGPVPTDHATHQIGLDVDIVYREPHGLRPGRHTLRQRRRIAVRPIVSVRTKRKTRFWEPRVAAMLELAARDPRVSRIYVNPVVKRELCRSAGFDRTWLRKLTPWWGHDRHFHLRLQCPANSPRCHKQQPLPPGDGCAEARWWLDPRFRAFHAMRHRLQRQRAARMPVLPAACRRVLRLPPNPAFRRTVRARPSRRRHRVGRGVSAHRRHRLHSALR